MGQHHIALDFSGLDKIGRTRQAQEAAKDFCQGEHGPENENASHGRTDTAEGKQPPAYHNIAQAKAEREELARTYAAQQENMRRAGRLRGEITKDIKAGQDPYLILLKALDCVSRMTGDRVFYEQNEAQLRITYGALGYITPIEQDLQAARERLARLLEGQTPAADPDRRANLDEAIRSHRELIEQLEAQLH